MMKIAVIDLGFHKKTKSFDFLLNILAESFELTYFYDDRVEGGAIDKRYLDIEFDFYVFLQVLPDFLDLLKIKNKKLVFVPMFDSSPMFPIAWSYYKGFYLKILCFSKSLFNLLANEGFDCQYLQYFSKPINLDINYDKRKIFFWYRGSISWEDVKIILGDQNIDLLTIKNCPDPGYQRLELSNEDVKRYNIELLDTFFETHHEHYKFLAKHNIFISPRIKEGIGMSFLDAMSMGQCVVANDLATMNEYIVHGVNGILTQFTQCIDLENFAKLGMNAKKSHHVGFLEYQSNKKCILLVFSSTFSKVRLLNISDYIFFGLINFRRNLIRACASLHKKLGNSQ